MVALVFSNGNAARRTANVPRALKQIRTVWKSRWPPLAPPSLIVLMVSVDVKQH